MIGRKRSMKVSSSLSGDLVSVVVMVGSPLAVVLVFGVIIRKTASGPRGLALALRGFPPVGVDRGGAVRLQGVKVIGGLLRMARGGEDRALVVLYDFEP